MDKKIKDVFICHASEDKTSIALPIANLFSREGISYWLDEAEIKWGDNIILEINDALQASRYILVIISNNFMQKNWPQKEMLTALGDEISSNIIRVLPLINGDDELLKEVYRQFPLLRDKFYLIWDQNPSRVINAVKEMLGLKSKNKDDFSNIQLRAKKSGHILALKMLKKTVESQLNEILFIYGFPSEHMPEQLSHTEKSIKLIKYAVDKEGDKVIKLLSIIREVID